jgi:hypothetical protein
MRKINIALAFTIAISAIFGTAAAGLIAAYRMFPSSGRIGTEENSVTANSGSVADIQTAVNQVEAAGGGTVYVPAGSWLFDATPNRKVTIHGGVNVFGAGKFMTNLTLRADATYASTMMFYVDGSNQLPVRISGITFIGRTGAAASRTGDEAIFLDNVKDFRVDNNSFHYLGSCGVAVFNSDIALTSQGVVDHNNFYDIYKPDAETAGNGFGYGVGIERTYDRTDQSKIWNTDINFYLGKYANVTYIEDNYFAGARHSISAYASGAYVARHNVFTDMHVYYPSGHADVHGAYPDGVYGGRYMEVYDNTFLNPANDPDYPHMDDYARALRMRGGGGVFFNNTATNYSYLISLASDDGNGATPKCKVRNLWIWGNTYDNALIDFEASYTQNVDYFLYKKSGYLPYPYPHPLTQEGVQTVLVTHPFQMDVLAPLRNEIIAVVASALFANTALKDQYVNRAFQ